MGRNGRGVREASSTSDEIAFTYQGKRCRERIKLKPSPTNRKRVENHLGAILNAIENNTFDYSKTFPDSPRRLQFFERQGQALLLSDYLDDWMLIKGRQLKASTKLSYEKQINLVNQEFLGLTLEQITRKK